MGKYRVLGALLDRVFRNDLNANFTDVDGDIQAQKQRVDDLIIGVPQPSEVVDSRGGFPVLRDRLDDLSSSVAQIVTNINKYKTGSNTYTDAIEAAIADGVKTIFFPAGEYPIIRPIRITKDNSFVLSKGTRIYADAPMAYMFDFNTDRPITSIYDLSKDCFITGGTLDGNGLADDILRLNKYLHFTLDNIEFKNGIKRGLVTNDTGGMAAELMAKNLHFINTITTNATADNKAIVNLGTDNHFENIITVDWTVGIHDKGNALIDKFHPWITHQSRIPNSIGFEIESNSTINEGFADTMKTAYKVISGNPRISKPKVYYNTSVYTSAYQTSDPIKFLDTNAISTVIVAEGRINGSGTSGITFVDTAYIGKVNSINNIFEGTVTNKFSAHWDIPYLSGAFLYSGSTRKGTLATSSTSVQLINEATGKVFRLGDDGTLLYDGKNLLGDTGTFTPTVTGSTAAGTPTYTIQSGRYTKFGKVVNCNLVVSGTFDGTIAGGLLVKGLPFAMDATHISGVSFGYIKGLKTPNGYVNAGATDLTLRTIDTNGSSVSIDTTTLRSTQFEYHLSFTYTTA
jgi:hypothetical protein